MRRPEEGRGVPRLERGVARERHLELVRVVGQPGTRRHLPVPLGEPAIYRNIRHWLDSIGIPLEEARGLMAQLRIETE